MLCYNPRSEPHVSGRHGRTNNRSPIEYRAVQEAEQAPEALFGQTGANGKVPAWVLAVPTPVIESF